MLIAEAGLIKGERIGVDASTMEANAALRNIVRRDNGEGYREMLERLARESGVETPTAEDLARLERKRKGKKLSNTDWVSKSDPEAKIAKMQDGTTHLAYKPEHAVDLDTGAVVAAELHPADEGDTTTLSKTLAKAEANLEAGSSLHKLAIVNDDDVIAVRAARARLSEDLHASPETINPSETTHAQLLKELKILEAWLKDVKDRQKTAPEPAVSYSIS